MADAQPPVEAPADSAQPAATEEAVVNGAPTTETPTTDTAMPDAPTEQATASPLPTVQAPSPAPHRIGTPTQGGSRAASAHPDPGLLNIPTEAPPHGDSTRRYLNTKVTGVLLEGVKQVARDRPEDPLRVLGEYLIQKSKELEGTK